MDPLEGADAPTRRGSTLVGVALTALVVLGALVYLFAFASGSSDEQAVRGWFASAAGGSAPTSATHAIHVGGCDFTDATVGKRPVMKCPITTDAPTPTLNTCFVFAGDKALSGGWQLQKLDACNALKFDAKRGDLVDLVGGSHYALVAH